MAESTEECKSLETITRKVKSEGKSNILKIQIEDQDNNITTVIVKKNMTMQKIMNAFYNRMGVDPAAFRVLHDGNSFALEHTPEELGITEEDVIGIFLHQEAGGYSTFGYKS